MPRKGKKGNNKGAHSFFDALSKSITNEQRTKKVWMFGTLSNEEAKNAEWIKMRAAFHMSESEKIKIKVFPRFRVNIWDFSECLE